MDKLEQALEDGYLYQKELLLSRFGSAKRAPPKLDRQRAAACIRPVLAKAAQIARSIDVPADVLMEAAFAYAKSMRHPDGPFPNMLGSLSYLTKALAFHYDVPAQVVMERGTRSWLLGRFDDRYAETLASVTADTDLFTSANYPIEHRLLIALRKLDLSSLVLLAPQVLERMAHDRPLAMWMASKGCDYEKLASIYNKHKHKQLCQ
jgi:hypothetical protein